MKNIKLIFIILIILSFVFQVFATDVDVNIPIREEAVNTFFSSIKPELAKKLKQELDAMDPFYASRGTHVYYAYFDFKSSNMVEFYFKANTKGTIDYWIFGSSPFTIYLKTKTKIYFDLVHDPNTDKLKTTITSVEDTDIEIWSSNYAVSWGIYFTNLFKDFLEDIIAEAETILPDMINNFIPPLDVNLPHSAKLKFVSRTYDQNRDAFYLGFDYSLEPLGVSISGPSSVHVPDKGMGSNSYTWTANVTNSTSPTYKWYKKTGSTYYLVGSQRSYTKTYSYEGYQSTSIFYLKVEVNDTDNRFASATKSVTMYHDAGSGGGEPLPKCPSQDQPIVPDELVLQNNYPNPFNPSTIISFGLPEDQHVKVVIYSLTGKKVITLVDDFLGKGFHDVQWDGRNQVNQNVPSGTYFYVLKTKKNKMVKKMFLLK
jgi:hypothetical protein